MIPVILGVLIALFLNNLKESADNKRFVNTVFDSIQKEMEANKKSLESVLPKQDTLLDSILYYLEDEKISISNILIACKGLQIPSIKNSAWRSFLNNKIELIDYETISMLSSVDEGRAIMDLKFNKLLDFLYEHTSATTQYRKEQMLVFLSNLIDSEQGLLEMHEAYLEHRNRE